MCGQCDLSVEELFCTYPEPLFYDVFMDLGQGEKTRKLLPLPTLVKNQQYNGRFINQGGILSFRACASVCVHCSDTFSFYIESINNWYLSRRMFLVDTLSGREKTMTSEPKVIRVASSVKIRYIHTTMTKIVKTSLFLSGDLGIYQMCVFHRFQLVPRTQEGQVFPPLMVVTYTDVSITDIKTQTVSVSSTHMHALTYNTHTFGFVGQIDRQPVSHLISLDFFSACRLPII